MAKAGSNDKKMEEKSRWTVPLKGQCHEIFVTFYIKKTPPRPHMNRQNWFCEIFHFQEDIREKRPRVVDLVNPYMDTVSKYSSKQLHKHMVNYFTLENVKN